MTAMLCPSCRKLISQDEPRCPYCGALRPGLWGFGPKLQRFFGRNLQLVSLISIACVVLYVTALALDFRAALSPSGGLMGILAPSSRALFLLGMTGGPSLHLGHWWTLLTAIFLHGSLLHIVFNVYWIRQLGTPVENELGPARFFVLFMVSGAGGFLLSNLLSSAPSIGASGSICGLLGGMIGFRRRRGATWEMLQREWMLAIVFIAFGLFVHGVDNWAHLGGLGTGFLLGSRLRGIDERAEERNVQLAALGLALLTLAGFVLSVVRFLPAFLAA